VKLTTGHLARTALALAIGATALTLGTQPAHAGSDWGVKEIAFGPTEDSCVEDPALPCTPGAGLGNANRLRIGQRASIDTGEVSFNKVTTTASDPDDVWLAARIGAECRTAYHLASAVVRRGLASHTSGAGAPPEVDETADWEGIGVPVPKAKEMPTKTVALNVPLDELFSPTEPMTSDFASLSDVYAYGEQRIANRVAQGMTEAEARADDFSVLTYVEVHAEVTCKHNTWSRYRLDREPELLPLIIEFEPHVTVAPTARPPARDRAIGGGLTTPLGVTDAALSVIPDPDDACTLHLSGTITAEVDTQVTYRFIDEYGQQSNGFVVDVEANVPEFVSHEVAVPSASTTAGETDGGVAGGHRGAGGLVAPTGPGTVGGLADQDTDRVTGTYQLKVESPNLVLSNIDGFNVAPCPAT
jgi:hypothetical protein